MGTTRKMVLAVAAALCGAAALAASDAAEAADFGYDDYAAVLKTYVDDQGMVNYKGLKADLQHLLAYTARLETLDPKTYEAWSEKAKIAFWINAYNGLTLKAILDHYPIQSSFGRSLIYPKNSIRQIAGVWTDITFPVMGKPITLDAIEHKVLRAKFTEPRVHLALVCAALGCPSLRNEPYAAERLDEQFDDQTRKFAHDPKKFRTDYRGRRVYLSPIFKWFGEDFVKTYGTTARYEGFSEKERAVLNYFRKFLKVRQRGFLASGQFSIRYLSYDWSLNEQ